MKISKLIFLSLIGVIALIIIAGSLDIRINGTKGSMTVYNNLKNSKIVLPAFKVLILNGSKNIYIVKGDSCNLVIGYPKDSLPPEINYLIRKDTLIINDLDLSHRLMMCHINVATEPNRFLLKNSSLILNGHFTQNISVNLFFDLDNSNVNIYQDNKIKSSLSFLDIKQKNKSRIYCNAFHLDSLKVDVQDSRTELHVNVDKVKGAVSDKGYLHLDSANEIVLKKDSESEIRIF